MTTRTAHRLAVVATLLVAIASCRKATPAPAYETVPVARRDIIVSATASGVIQPILTLSVKSKASGEIIAMPVQTGDEVKRGQLLAKVDPRIPQNNLTQALANLDTVQVSALVDETDVGKVQAGMPVTITVDAFPNRTFDGSVLKIEPQAQVTQNVTMFPVQVNIPNAGHVLKPGMNTEVEIQIGQRQGVLAVPNAALRTPRDVASAARVLGLNVQAVERQLASPDGNGGNATPLAGADTTDGSKLHAAEPKPGRATFTTPSGRVITLPPGVSAEQVKAAFAKRMTGQELTPAEQALLAQIRTQFQASPGGGGTGSGGVGGGGENASAARYIVFAQRGGKITAVLIRTGLTDQDYMEVTRGLSEKDSVIVLSSTAAQ